MLNNVRAVLMLIVDMPEAEKRRGNMVCNCIVEVVPHDRGDRQRGRGDFGRIQAGVSVPARRRAASRVLDARTNTTALARYLVSSIQGLCVTAKAGALT